MTGPLEGIRGALIDVDGTLLDGERAIPGAAGALRRLRAAGFRLRLTTNTTRRPRTAIAAALRDAGIEVDAAEIVVPASLARRRILDSGRPRAALMVPAASREDFDGVQDVAEGPDWVVMGDLGAEFTFETLNRAFHWVRQGAPLIALHRNRFWRPAPDRLVLDAGPFVAAIEYATGTTALVVGKPSPSFFDLALEELGLPATRVVSVGDSLENDCAGAARAGCRTVLVRTGLGGAAAAGPDVIRPDLVIESIARLHPG